MCLQLYRKTQHLVASRESVTSAALQVRTLVRRSLSLRSIDPLRGATPLRRARAQQMWRSVDSAATESFVYRQLTALGFSPKHDRPVQQTAAHAAHGVHAVHAAMVR